MMYITLYASATRTLICYFDWNEYNSHHGVYNYCILLVRYCLGIKSLSSEKITFSPLRWTVHNNIIVLGKHCFAFIVVCAHYNYLLGTKNPWWICKSRLHLVFFFFFLLFSQCARLNAIFMENLVHTRASNYIIIHVDSQSCILINPAGIVLMTCTYHSHCVHFKSFTYTIKSMFHRLTSIIYYYYYIMTVWM